MSRVPTKYCEIRDCTRAHNTYTEKLGPRIGLCSTHYGQLAHYGYIAVATGNTPRNRPYGVQECQLEDCTNRPIGSYDIDGQVLFICHTHRTRLEKYGDVHAKHSPPGRPKRRNPVS